MTRFLRRLWRVPATCRSRRRQVTCWPWGSPAAHHAQVPGYPSRGPKSGNVKSLTYSLWHWNNTNKKIRERLWCPPQPRSTWRPSWPCPPGRSCRDQPTRPASCLSPPWSVGSRAPARQNSNSLSVHLKKKPRGDVSPDKERWRASCTLARRSCQPGCREGLAWE